MTPELEAPPAPTPAQLASHVMESWATWLLKGRRSPQAHSYVWASAWRPCERRMYYELVCPDQQAPLDATVLAKFRRGDDRERDLLADLPRIGRDADPPFTVLGQQERFELKDRRGRVVIAGKVDARLKIGTARPAPMEVKAWAPNLIDRIETFEDLFENQYTRSGGFQLLCYLFGANEPFGFLLLDGGSLPRLIPVELSATNLDRLEEFLSRAERVLDAVALGEPPDFYDDPAECHRCSFFGTACQPPIHTTPVQVLTDPAIESALERWWELRPAGKEWAALDADLKRHLRGIENAVAGHFSILGRWGKTSRVDLPPDLKRQYTVSDSKGRFTLEIERL